MRIALVLAIVSAALGQTRGSAGLLAPLGKQCTDPTDSIMENLLRIEKEAATDAAAAAAAVVEKSDQARSQQQVAQQQASDRGTYSPPLGAPRGDAAEAGASRRGEPNKVPISHSASMLTVGH